MGDNIYGIGGFINAAPGVLSGKNPPPETFRGALGQFYYDFSSDPPTLFIYNGSEWIATTVGSKSFSITPFVVGPVGQGGYQTVQAAINAATLNGGGIVYIMPGTYIENLTIGENVYLVGYIQDLGNVGFTIAGSETLPVTITGNLFINVLNAPATPTNQFKYINFTCTSGNLVTFIGNLNLLVSGIVDFIGCQLTGGTGCDNIFFNDGFFNLNIDTCTISEENFNTVDLMAFGVTAFNNLQIRNSYIAVNTLTPVIYPNGAFNTMALNNCYYSARIDASTGTQSLQITAAECTFSYSSNSAGDPLINFGSNSGSMDVSNSVIIDTPGNLANSTNTSASSSFVYTNCTWLNELQLGVNGRGDFYFCTLQDETGAALTVSTGQNIILSDCIIISPNNPSIAGTGTGILSINNCTWQKNANIANTLTLAGLSLNPTTNSSLSSGTLSIKSTTTNNGNNAGFLKVLINGTTAFLPYFTNIAP